MNINPIDLIIGFAYLATLFFLIYWLIYIFEEKKNLKNDIKSKPPTLDNHPFVSIVVPAYNEEKTIINTILSLEKLNYPNSRYEIIIVNDSSTDSTKEVTERYIEKNKSKISIQLINQLKNKGKAEALNAALKKTKGEFFACMDADSVVDKDALLFMIDMFNKDNKLAIVTPVMRIHEPKTLIQKFQRLEYITAMLISRIMGNLDCMYVAPGPFSIYRMSVLRKLGKFDGTNNVEDQEIAWRAQKYHYKIRQCPNAFVNTIAPNSIKSFTRQRIRWYRGGLMTLKQYRKLLFNKKYGDFGMLQIPLTILSYILSLIGVIIFGYYIIKPAIRQINNWILTRFDILTDLKNMKFNFNVLDIEVGKMMLIYAALIITILILYYASRLTNERVRKYGSIYIIPYFFIYYIVLGIIFLRTLFEMLINKKQKW